MLCDVAVASPTNPRTADNQITLHTLRDVYNTPLSPRHVVCTKGTEAACVVAHTDDLPVSDMTLMVRGGGLLRIKNNGE